MSNESRRSIMATAWRIVKATGYTISNALKKAWVLFKIRAKMSTGIVEFRYRKVDGTTRQAFGTLDNSKIRYEYQHSQRKPNDTLFTYYDTEKQEFRSFKIWNILPNE